MSIVVIGVAGSGKTTIGASLAARLGMRFVDADNLHPVSNVAKMTAGVPLSDDDRVPWLSAVGEVLAAGGVVVACSALKRRYRDRLRAFDPSLELIYLRGEPALLSVRIRERPGHFMPASLLDSQLAALEPPTADENPLVLDVSLPPELLVDHALTAHHFGKRVRDSTRHPAKT